MRVNSRTWLIAVAVAGTLVAGAACTGGTSKTDSAKAVDATKAAGEKGAEVAKDAARATADKAGEVAGEIAAKSKKVASETSAAVTDGWITTKLKAKFADEIVLKASDIHVTTTDHVVTLTGTVKSSAAKTRADDIAKGTDGVTRVINRVVVK